MSGWAGSRLGPGRRRMGNGPGGWRGPREKGEREWELGRGEAGRERERSGFRPERERERIFSFFSEFEFGQWNLKGFCGRILWGMFWEIFEELETILVELKEVHLHSNNKLSKFILN